MDLQTGHNKLKLNIIEGTLTGLNWFGSSSCEMLWVLPNHTVHCTDLPQSPGSLGYGHFARNCLVGAYVSSKQDARPPNNAKQLPNMRTEWGIRFGSNADVTFALLQGGICGNKIQGCFEILDSGKAQLIWGAERVRARNRKNNISGCKRRGRCAKNEWQRGHVYSSTQDIVLNYSAMTFFLTKRDQRFWKLDFEQISFKTVSKLVHIPVCLILSLLWPNTVGVKHFSRVKCSLEAAMRAVRSSSRSSSAFSTRHCYQITAENASLWASESFKFVVACIHTLPWTTLFALIWWIAACIFAKTTTHVGLRSHRSQKGNQACPPPPQYEFFWTKNKENFSGSIWQKRCWTIAYEGAVFFTLLWAFRFAGFRTPGPSVREQKQDQNNVLARVAFVAPVCTLTIVSLQLLATMTETVQGTTLQNVILFYRKHSTGQSHDLTHASICPAN